MKQRDTDLNADELSVSKLPDNIADTIQKFDTEGSARQDDARDISEEDLLPIESNCESLRVRRVRKVKSKSKLLKS